MKNITIAIGTGWFVTIYLAVLILRNSMNVYNIFFLLILSSIFNMTLIDHTSKKINYFPKAKKSRRKK